MDMNFTYHRKTLCASDVDHPMVCQALSMLDVVEKAMEDVVAEKISIEKYIDIIMPYDKFMYQSAKMKPQKSNPINTLQNKKYSTWREQKWAPIWELVRKEIAVKWKTNSLVLIQNLPVVESIYSSGYLKFKDVDGGIGFKLKLNNKEVLFPIVAVEDKGGHACSTCFDGVSAQSLRLHRCLPNAFHVFITDNDISVGKDKVSDIYNDIDLIVSERGTNRNREDYPKLVAKRFEEVKNGMIDRLSKMSIDDFTKYHVISSTKTSIFREDIDKSGVVWNK